VSRKDDFVKNKEKAKRKLGQSSMVNSRRRSSAEVCWSHLLMRVCCMAQVRWKTEGEMLLRQNYDS
jgi:hypothetical protein